MPSLLVLLHLCEDLAFVSRDVTAVLQTLLKASEVDAAPAAVSWPLLPPLLSLWCRPCTSVCMLQVGKHSRKDAWQKVAAAQTTGQQALQQQSVLQLADR